MLMMLFQLILDQAVFTVMMMKIMMMMTAGCHGFSMSQNVDYNAQKYFLLLNKKFKHPIFNYSDCKMQHLPAKLATLMTLPSD